MDDDIIDRLNLIAAWRKPGGPTPEEKMPSTYAVTSEAAASIERLRRLLHKYGDRIPLATNARPDWQQEIDEAFEWVANNPESPS